MQLNICPFVILCVYVIRNRNFISSQLNDRPKILLRAANDSRKKASIFKSSFPLLKFVHFSWIDHFTRPFFNFLSDSRRRLARLVVQNKLLPQMSKLKCRISRLAYPLCAGKPSTVSHLNPAPLPRLPFPRSFHLAQENGHYLTYLGSF